MIYDHKTGLSKKYKHEPREDITGLEVGLLTVLEDAGTRNNKRYWLCECKCGVRKQILHSHLSGHKVQSCGCIKKGSSNALWKGHGEISGNRWDMIKRRRRHAEDREFTVTIEEAWDLFLKQNRKCALSGIEIEFGKTGKDLYTASLDRIDSNKGYTIDNVQWLHKHVNWMKNTFSQEYFVEMCKKIAHKKGCECQESDYTRQEI